LGDARAAEKRREDNATAGFSIRSTGSARGSVNKHEHLRGIGAGYEEIDGRGGRWRGEATVGVSDGGRNGGADAADDLRRKAVGSFRRERNASKLRESHCCKTLDDGEEDGI
jgi:hypothetical protein